jgi:hypothetical protein
MRLFIAPFLSTVLLMSLFRLAIVLWVWGGVGRLVLVLLVWSARSRNWLTGMLHKGRWHILLMVLLAQVGH